MDSAETGVAAPGTVTLDDFSRMVRRRWRTVLATVLLCLALAAGFDLLSGKTYEAVAVVTVTPMTDPASGVAGSVKDISTVTESRIITSTSVAQRAATVLHWPGAVDALLTHVAVTSPASSQVLNVRFTASSAAEAARGANAFADSYLAFRSDSAQAALDSGAARLSDRITALERQVVAANSVIGSRTATAGDKAQADALRRSLTDQISTLRAQQNRFATVTTAPGQVVGRAQVPSSPRGPRLSVYLAVGAVVGLLLGLLIAAVRDRHDDSVRDEADLERTSGAPVLATLPTTSVLAPGGPGDVAAVVDPAGGEADAYRRLAAKLLAGISGDGLDDVLVLRSGPLRGDLAPLNLAVTLAAQGLRVALVAAHAGILAGHRTIDAIPALRAPMPVELVGRLHAVPEVGGLTVLPLGDELVLDATLRRAPDGLAQLRQVVDVAVIDGVNVDLPSSGLTLGRHARAVILLAERGRTTRASVAHACAELAQVGAVVLGAVLLEPSAATTATRGSSRPDRVALPSLQPEGEPEAVGAGGGEHRSARSRRRG